MPGKRTSMNRQKLQHSAPPGIETGVDPLSAPQGSQAMSWDPELLKPFLSQVGSDLQPSEGETLRKGIAEGTAYLLYQRMKEEADSELQSSWLFLPFSKAIRT